MSHNNITEPWEMAMKRLSQEAYDTALTLIEGHGVAGAMDYVGRALNCGSDRYGFWLRVRGEIVNIEKADLR